MNKFRYVKRVKVLSEFPSQKKKKRKGPTLFRGKIQVSIRSVDEKLYHFNLDGSQVGHPSRAVIQCKIFSSFFFFFFNTTVEKENRIKNIQKTKFDDSHREILICI